MNTRPAPELSRQMANAIRKASQNALDALSALVPEFFGGSADLTGSKLTNFKGCVKYVGRSGIVLGISSFGESAPAKDLYAHFGITSARVVDAVRTLAYHAAHQREPMLPEQIVPSNN